MRSERAPLDVNLVAHKDSNQPGPGQSRAELPSWPFTLAFAGFPLWWLLGLLEFIWIPAACIMILYMVRRGAIGVPRGFGAVLLFLLWAGCAVVGLSTSMQVLRFGFALANYAACATFFVYVFNARARLTDRFVSGVLTVWWLIVVAGGYIALILPKAVFRTPASLLVPGSLLQNEWVRQLVIRPLNQYNPNSYFQLDPRPSAPFIYTNQWGSVYSLLIPIVIAYLIQTRGTRRFWLILAAVPVSFVPAILTTNRGMLLGIGIAALYGALRLVLRRDFRGIGALAAVALVGGILFRLLPTADRLESRIASPSIVDRAWLYLRSLEAVMDSPLLGYGRTLTVPGAVDPVGTQGEFWIVLVRYGVPAALLFLGWFVFAFVRSIRWTSAVDMAANLVLLIALVEFFFYGAAPQGLVVAMVAAALVLRSRTSRSTEDSYSYSFRAIRKRRP